MSFATALAAPASAAIFGTGEIAVLTVKDGQSDAAAALAVNFYDVYTGALTGSVDLSSTGQDAITLSGVVDHDGHLSVSSNREYLLLGGYRAEVGADNPVSSAAAEVARVIGRIGADMSIDTSTALTDAYDHTDINAVVSDDGQRFWVVGEGKYITGVDTEGDDIESPTNTGGLRYVAALGDTTSINLSQTQINSTSPWPDAYRSAAIIDGQLYLFTASPESFGNRGAYITADPLPTASVDTPQTMIGVITNLEGNKVDKGQQLNPDDKGKQVPKTDLVMLDLDPTIAGMDTAYSTGGKDLFEKWALRYDSDSDQYLWWQVSTDSIDPIDHEEEILALEATVDDEGNAVLFLSTGFGIYRLVDDAGYDTDTNLSGSTDLYFINPTGNDTFRGLAIVPEPTSLALLGLSGLLMVGRRRRPAM